MNEDNNTRAIFTIAIPTYNRALYLRKCLENIYSQLGNDNRIEVLVCDNDSSDNTIEVINEYKEKYE